MGLLSWKGIDYADALAGTLHFSAQAFWHHALREYTSISS
jgi:hypothetical protein